MGSNYLIKFLEEKEAPTITKKRHTYLTYYGLEQQDTYVLKEGVIKTSIILRDGREFNISYIKGPDIISLLKDEVSQYTSAPFNVRIESETATFYRIPRVLFWEYVNQDSKLQDYVNSYYRNKLAEAIFRQQLMTMNGKNGAVWAITSGLSFAGGVYIILSGVRLIVGEIVPAFRGIAEKLVPGAIPAIDCPVVFPYAPNAVLIGFLVSFLGGIVGLFVLAFIDKSLVPCALILPGVIPHFFCGATAGVFGNAEGGLKGCVFGSFMHGLLITFLPAICMPVMGSLNFANCTFSDADFSWLGIVLGNIAQHVQGTGLLVICVVIFLLPIVYNFVAPKKAEEK